MVYSLIIKSISAGHKCYSSWFRAYRFIGDWPRVSLSQIINDCASTKSIRFVSKIIIFRHNFIISFLKVVWKPSLFFLFENCSFFRFEKYHKFELKMLWLFVLAIIVPINMSTCENTNLAAIRWAHAVNNQKLLKEALDNSKWAYFPIGINHSNSSNE